MQTIRFDIEKLALGSVMVTPPTGAGGFDQILGSTRYDMLRANNYGESVYDRPHYADRSGSSTERERSIFERQERSRDEAVGRSRDDRRADRDQRDYSPSSAADRAARAESDDRTEKSDTQAGTEDSRASRTASESAANEGDTAPAAAAVAEINQTGQAAGTAGNSGSSSGEMASKASAASGQAAVNPALQRGPQQEASAQGNRHAGNGGSNAPAAPPQGQDGKGLIPASRQPNGDASGLELSIQKGPAATGAPTQLSSATALGVLQEQAVDDGQKAEGENRLLLRAAGQQKASLAAGLGGSGGQPGRQGGSLGQQKDPATGQLLTASAKSGQGSAASATGHGQSLAGMVMPAANGTEGAPTLAPSGQPIPAVLAGNPTGAMQAAIQAAAPEQFRQGPIQQGPAEQVSVQIQTAVRSGVDRISIQLNPAELGKIDVKMELGDDGQLRAIISAEKPETLELLQRDARALEKSLHDAGLKTDMNSLAFQKGGHDRNAQTEEQLANHSSKDSAEVRASVELEPSPTSLHDGTLDISV